MKNILFTLFLILSLSGCYPGDYYSTKHYVIGYVELDKIYLSIKPHAIIELRAKGDENNIYTKSVKKEKYNYLCSKHRDKGYNKKIEIGTSGGVYPNFFMAHDFIAVEIISDSDFDREHPAGTSLGDIALFHGLTPCMYIQNGYKDFDWLNYEYLEDFRSLFSTSIPGYNYDSQGWGSLYPVRRIVDELTNTDLTVLGSGDLAFSENSLRELPFAVITFIKEPELEKEHNIFIRMTDDDGGGFETSALVNFE